MNRTLSSLALAGDQAMAGDLMHWQNNSLTYLYDRDSKIDPENQQTVNFEHASGWRVGDLFCFVDGIKFNTEAANGTGQNTPRLLVKVYVWHLARTRQHLYLQTGGHAHQKPSQRLLNKLCRTLRRNRLNIRVFYSVIIAQWKLSMLSSPHRTRLRTLLLSLIVTLTACSTLTPGDPLRIQLVGVEPLPGEDLEMRFAVKLRVQNPNNSPIDFDGVALQLKVNQQPLLSGVSDQSGQIPRYGETILHIPVSLSAYAALRQAWGAAGYQDGKGLPYELSGKLAAGFFDTWRFNDRGTLNWPQLAPR
jgi:LEA14-like dessication related protein